MSRYSAQILADAPECYWRMGTTLADLSGNAHTPSVGGAAPTDVAGLIGNDDDRAKGFAGAVASYWQNFTYRVVTAGAQRTVEIWLTNNKTGATFTVPWLVYGGVAFTCLQIGHATGNVALYVESTLQGTWAAALPIGTYGATHLVVTMDDATNTAELFVNGVSKGTVTMATPWAAAGATIGCLVGAPFGGQLTDGTTDEFAVYNRIVTRSAIERHYTLGLGQRTRPRESLKLHVEIEDLNGATHYWGPDEVNPNNVPKGLTWRTQRGDGFADATIRLGRRTDRDWPDLDLLAKVKIVGDSGRVAYEGRVVGTPRQIDDDGHEIQVQAQGWMAHARDRAFQEIYIDRDLSAWTEPSHARRAFMFALVTAIDNESSMSVGFQDAGSQLPAIMHTFSRYATAYRSWRESWYYGGGVDLGSMRYDLLVTGGSLLTWNSDAGFSNDDLASVGGTFDVGTNHGQTTATLQTVTATAAGRKYAFLQNYPTTSPNGEAPQIFGWQSPRVFGRSGVNVWGDWGAEGVYASDVIRNLAQRFCPMLDPSGIVDTTYPIKQAAWKSATDPYDAWLEVNRYHLWDLCVWEDRILYYTPPDPTRIDWKVRELDPGVRTQLQGDSAGDLVNGCAVVYTDLIDGRQKILWPDVYDALRDDTSTNPANRAGYPVWTVTTLDAPTIGADALQAGAAKLAEFNEPKTPGTIVVRGYVLDAGDNEIPAYAVRCAENVSVIDHPNDSPRPIAETVYDDATQTVSITLDAPPDRIDAAIARLANARAAVGL